MRLPFQSSSASRRTAGAAGFLTLSNIIVAKPGPNRTRITNARVTVRDAEGRADKRWLASENEYHDVLCGEFGLNMSGRDIDQCVSRFSTCETKLMA
jgi:hypothetical protein